MKTLKQRLKDLKLPMKAIQDVGICTREHAWLILSGKKKSPSMENKIEQFIKDKEEDAIYLRFTGKYIKENNLTDEHKVNIYKLI